MSRFRRPPTPEEWTSAAAECLRENYPDAGVLVQAGPSGATRIKIRTDSPHLAYIDAWPSLKIAASGPQAQRDAALEVLAGAGFVDGWSPGAIGRMRATMPADEDAGAKPPDRPADEGGGVSQDLPQDCLDHIEAALAALKPIEQMDSNTAQAGRALREAFALLEPYTAAARAKWSALEAAGDLL